MTTPGSDRGVSFSPETRFVESLSMFGGRRTSISFEEERQHAPHRFREAPPPLRKDPSLMMFATHADARAAAERRKSLSPMSVATPSPPRREADDEERRRSAATDDEERRRSAAALEAERRRSDALRESREALARETVWKSNLQPDFNVRVIERIAPDSSAVLRELDESNRFVQKSAESTSI